jgi:type III secretion protein T
MEYDELFDMLLGKAVVISLATSRLAIAFIILPVFSNELIPAMVRNSIFVALALVTVILHSEVTVESMGITEWLSLFGKEALIGIIIGVLFGIHLWAFEAAGMIIDMQVGMSMAQILDPVSGHETSLIGEFLARLANYIFITAGGLMLITSVLMASYSLWPIQQMIPNLSQTGVSLLVSEFSYFFRLTLLIASPVLVVVFLIDGVMGLINRYAQQFNVTFMSMSLKILAAIAILMITIVRLAELLVAELMKHTNDITGQLNSLFGV